MSSRVELASRDPWVGDDTAHRLRSPLTAARLRLESLVATGELDAEVAAEVHATLADLCRIGRAIDDIGAR